MGMSSSQLTIYPSYFSEGLTVAPTNQELIVSASGENGEKSPCRGEASPRSSDPEDCNAEMPPVTRKANGPVVDPGGKVGCMRKRCMRIVHAKNWPNFYVVFAFPEDSSIVWIFINLPYFLFVMTSERSERSESPIHRSSHPLSRCRSKNNHETFHHQTSPNIFISRRLDQSNARFVL